MLTLILFVVMLLILIIPHELGHMIMAKVCGVYVSEFSIGMGPRLFSKKIGETEYQLRLLPLGGYCRMLSGDEEGEDPNNPRAFNNKTAGQKLAILCAGVVMNVFIAWAILTGIMAYYGVVSNVLSEVPKDGPAYEAGVRAGDKVVDINGNKVKTWTDVQTELSEIGKDDQVEMTVERDGMFKTYYMPTEYDKANDRYVTGIVGSISKAPIDVINAGTEATVRMNSQILNGFLSIIKGDVGKDAVGGPVKIVQVVDQTREYGIQMYLLLIAMVSLNLAIFNITPIPSLDGARMLFVIVRKLSGNRISNDMENAVHVIGMLFLIGILIFVTVNDVMSIF